jgi:hypothetical protein
MWELAAKFEGERELHIGQYVYESIPVPDAVKAEVYQHESNPLLRLAILDICGTENQRTLELGSKDRNGDCKSLANEKLEAFQPPAIEKPECDANWTFLSHPQQMRSGFLGCRGNVAMG